MKVEGLTGGPFFLTCLNSSQINNSPFFARLMMTRLRATTQLEGFFFRNVRSSESSGCVFFCLLHRLIGYKQGFFVAACLLWVVADSAVILHHRIPPNYYLHNGQHYGYHQCPYQYLEAMDNVVDSRDYYYSADIVPRHPLENGDDVKRLLADYSFNDIEGRTGIGSGTEDIRIPNYRLFHFVLRLVRTMRRHFLPVYATHPDDISNIYAQYNEHELRRRNA